MSPPKPRIFVKEGTFPSKKDYMWYEKRYGKNNGNRHGVESQGNSLNRFENLNLENSRVILVASDG